jgi:hypothetical protein
MEWHEITDDTLSWPALGSTVIIGMRIGDHDVPVEEVYFAGGEVDRHLKVEGRLVGFSMSKREFSLVPFDDLNALRQAWWADAPELPL